jgi:pimeloyl-ACP methyl ester carboxylesterase
MSFVVHSFTFPGGQETISGAILSANKEPAKPRFVFLHGAGKGVKERIYDLAEVIIKSGRDMLAIDFSGHGASSGELKKSSLEKRVKEARSAIDQFTSREALTICGSSMGGYIALKMLRFYEVENLILFCPALYDKKAYSVKFDEGFSEIIRASKSWENTDALSDLKEFSGKLLLVMGDQDEVIPDEVIDLIFESATLMDELL